MTAAVDLRVISVLMHIETMQLYQAHYVGCVMVYTENQLP